MVYSKNIKLNGSTIFSTHLLQVMHHIAKQIQLAVKQNGELILYVACVDGCID